ncbi:DUF3301 domain-containing protein [Accumulibacter sp.]|uniref:DUF3301 domain-containing protein n=1 Tax=Accumulibacter sp. TaxID=2053492 RepID=UPI0025E864D8|nr:DUF3301 domain-containing protein [Accumulibacter sp.]MCM8612278.1 DUF3301 domain-containing protein [Accumulibacter sp.]MCM8635951.1 DUF3301 domain-containing protein [Accumulibacter sp.]MCM8639440.1 DUF3301 domain-containing protein [Accumulibacter sp.]
MMPWLEICGLGVLLLAGWLWFDGFQARAAAMRAARAACAADGLLLLDDTVALAHLRLQRDDDGRLRLRRTYDFEYSDTGDNRRVAQLALLGDEVLLLRLMPPATGAGGRLRVVGGRQAADDG